MHEKHETFFKRWYQTIPLGPERTVQGEQDCAPRWKAMRRLHGDMTSKRVIDLGAAEGFFACACADQGAQVVAVERDRATYERLCWVVNARKLSARVECCCASCEAESPDDERNLVDVILSLNLIHHLEGPLHHVATCHQLLRAGGVLYLEAPWEAGDRIRFRKQRQYILQVDFLRALLGRFFTVEIVHDWTNSVGNRRIMWECVKC